ncbi:MAG: hypothetical protein E6J41_26360 [Chloroflexi bacterium]|nr:MAG: hypothetical protein E6J41_26360 [Chloroflexota bacterium]
MDREDGVPERMGRALGRALHQGRAIVRQLGDPAVQDHLIERGRAAAARHPDVVERAAQHVTDRALWGIAVRAGVLGAALHQMRPSAGQAVGRLARGIAESLRRPHDEP